MPRRSVSWSCDTCRRSFCSYDEARDCELNHVVADAAQRASAAIAAAIEREGPRIIATKR